MREKPHLNVKSPTDIALLIVRRIEEIFDIQTAEKKAEKQLKKLKEEFPEQEKS